MMLRACFDLAAMILRDSEPIRDGWWQVGVGNVPTFDDKLLHETPRRQATLGHWEPNGILFRDESTVSEERTP